MHTHLVLTVTCDDKPGVIEAIAACISSFGGNWLESELANLAGKFVGVVRVSIQRSQVNLLQEAFTQLKNKDILITCQEESEEDSTYFESSEISKEPTKNKEASFHALGPDRKGIIRELSGAFSSRHINVDRLETKLSSMPYSGEPLFEASGKIKVPNNEEIDSLHQRLDDIANDLGIDISIKLLRD